jgi:hypothetical protein
LWGEKLVITIDVCDTRLEVGGDLSHFPATESACFSPVLPNAIVSKIVLKSCVMMFSPTKSQVVGFFVCFMYGVK